VKRIAIVTISISWGGAERAMNLLANEISHQGEYEVCLIPLNNGPSDLIQLRCEVFEIHRVWRGGLLNTLRARSQFEKVIEKYRPDFLIVNCDLPEAFAAVSRYKGELVVVEHSTRSWENRVILGKLVRIVLLIRGAIWVKVSSKILDAHCRSFGVIPNIIDSTELLPLNYNAVKSSQSKLVFVGRIAKEKRVDLFLELATSTGMNALIIGDGPLRGKLQSSYSKLDSVRFLGQVHNPWQLVSVEDLVVVTSDYEGDGLVPLEATALGFSVALRDVPDLRALNFPERSYFTSSEDFKEKIEKFGSEFFLLNGEEKEIVLVGRTKNSVYAKWRQLFATNF
jgi:glycosyltransferase involved in cell wall biosynthesis